MIKLLSTICLILAIVLSPPAVLAVVSNNAVPGDLTYPIKRGLEDVIYAVASLNPATKAWFAGARSNKRYEEVTALLAQGKAADQTLNELVEQTQMAAIQINQVSDPAQKEKLVKELSNSISKYDAGLAEIQKINQPIGETVQSPPAQPTAVVNPSPAVVSSQPPARFQPSAVPQAADVPHIVEAPRPSVVPQTTVVPVSLNTPQPAVVSQPPAPGESSFKPTVPPPTGNSNIDRARGMLEGIKRDLQQEKPSQSINEVKANQQEQGSNEQRDQKDKQEKTDRGSNKKGKRND